jgi:hypothetical protein
MDVILIIASNTAAWTFLRTICGATIGQAAFLMVNVYLLVAMAIANI